MSAVALLAAAAAACAQERVRTPEHQFVASTNGQVYYWVGCDAWRDLNASNLRYFRTAADAERAGYTPSRARGCAPQLATAPITPTVNGSAPCVVDRIADGDSFECRGGSRVRLILSDAPESQQRPYGDSATAVATRLMPPGSEVRLEFDVELYDPFGRILAYAYAGDLFVNRELVRSGAAVVAVFPPNVKHVDALRAAMDSARAERRGFWADGGFTCLPADFRAGRCR